MKPHLSRQLYQRAKRVIPGGVNSPVRAFNAVGGSPFYAVKGKAAEVTTADGRRLVDYCGSWGPLLFGHARREIVEAVRRAAEDGTSFGINTPREVEFAEQLCARVPSMDKVRLVSSGTEAVMTALRLARGFTGRGQIVKFDGCYHGHSDAMLVSAGSGVLTGGRASSAGVSQLVAGETLVCQYNSLESVQRVMRKQGQKVAAIIVEPIAGNMGLILPKPDFLEGLRRTATRHGALLIFDEVITGFRLGPTTYGELCGVRPDLTCLGKIIGGGLPIGAVGGRRKLMDFLAPLGPVYQAGTLSGNPVAVAAGLAMLKLVKKENPYPRLERLGLKLARGMSAAAVRAGVPLRWSQKGGMFTPFFCKEAVTDLSSAKHCDTRAYASFFNGMLERGIYLPPSQFETAFISAAHTDKHVEDFVRKAADCLENMK